MRRLRPLSQVLGKSEKEILVRIFGDIGVEQRDLLTVGDVAQGHENRPGSGRVGFPPDGGVGLICLVAKGETAKRDEGRMGGSFREATGDGVWKSGGEEGGAIDDGTVFRRHTRSAKQTT